MAKSETDCFVAVQGEARSDTKFAGLRRFCTPNREELMQSLVSEKMSSLLVMAVVDEIGHGKQVCKDLFTQFAEHVSTPAGSHTQFTLLFADDASGDLIQYRCDRLTDIDAVVEEEGGEHLCATTCATTITPATLTFDFVETRLTIIVCTQQQYSSGDLVSMAELAAEAMACRIRSICVLLPGPPLLSRTPKGIDAAVGELKTACTSRVFGRDERASLRMRLQDVRAWSQFVNEHYRFAPATPGPYFVSLNPQFAVGEKLVHAIPEEVTYLVGEGSIASAWDFVALSPAVEHGLLHSSVYSPHCRIVREGLKVWVKPECGMTYVNGRLLKEATLLENNDRVIIGKQLAFRFVVVPQTAPTTASSRIYDWELCSKEFRQQADSQIAKGSMNQLEADNKALRERVAALEREVANKTGNAWLVLTNPPNTHRGKVIWPLDLRDATTEEVTIGPSSDATVSLPFLTNSATLKRDHKASLVLKCGTATVALSHGSRFVIGSYSFMVSLDPQTAPAHVNATKLAAGTLNGDDGSEEVRQLRLSCFDLQWAVALLFDFVFPPAMKLANGTRARDEYGDYRRDICRDTIMTSQDFSVSQLLSLNQQLTSSIRMIGAGMAKEVNAAYIGCREPDSAAKAKARDENVLSAAARSFLESVKGATGVEAALLQRYHREAGALLVGLNASNGAAGGGEQVLDGAAKTAVSPHKNGQGSPRNGSESRSSSVVGGPVPPLSTLNMVSATKGSSANVERRLQTHLTTLKGLAFIATAQVIRRAGNIMDVLAVSPNPKALWDRYLKVLAILPVPEGSLVLRQNYFLAILDIVLSTEFCISRGLLSKSEMKHLDTKMDQWQENLINFAAAFDEPGQQRRAVWRRDAALQKRATPRLRPSSLKALAPLSSTTAPSPKGGAAQVSPPKSGRRNRSSTPSGRRSSSKDAASKPKRSLSASVTSGRTPAHLSSFGRPTQSPKPPVVGRSGRPAAPPTPSKDKVPRPQTGGAGGGGVTPGHSPRSLPSTPRAGIPSPSSNTPRGNTAAGPTRGRADGAIGLPKRKPDGARKPKSAVK